MATAESVKEKIRGLIDSANAATGNSDADLTAAVGALIAGFEKGGPGGSGGIYMAKVTLSEYMANLPINHNLGTTDVLFVAAWAETLGENTPTNNMTLCKSWSKTDIPTRRGGNGFSNGYTWADTYNAANSASPNVASNETLTIIDANKVRLPGNTSGTTTGYYPGITYTVFVIAASAFAGV